MLDAYAEPPRDAATLAARREALLDQLGWLEDEAAALAPLLAGLPAWALDQAPLPTDLSAKETFAALAALDREVYPAWVARLGAEDAPEVVTPDPLPGTDGANERDLDALLGDLRAARAALRETVGAVPEAAWARAVTVDGEATDLYGLVLLIVRRDADHLKELAYRLHEADLRTPEA
ncbi:MAG: DinB family protein [Bacteroidota bacterium]